MKGSQPQDQIGTWQLVSVNVNRETSADVDDILNKVTARVHTCSFFLLQEMRSWDVPNLKLHGYVCHGSKFGLAALVVSDRFLK